MTVAATILSATFALVLCAAGMTYTYRRWIIQWRKRRAWQRLWDESTQPGYPFVL